MTSPLPAPVSGPAYSVAVRVGVGTFDTVAQQPSRAWLLPGAGPAVVGGSYDFSMRSVTTIDGHAIRRSGLTEKRVEWPELRSARIAGFVGSKRPGLRAESGKSHVFNGGTPALVRDFAAIAAAHPPGRPEPP